MMPEIEANTESSCGVCIISRGGFPCPFLSLSLFPSLHVLPGLTRGGGETHKFPHSHGKEGGQGPMRKRGLRSAPAPAVAHVNVHVRPFFICEAHSLWVTADKVPCLYLYGSKPVQLEYRPRQARRRRALLIHGLEKEVKSPGTCDKVAVSQSGGDEL